MAIPAVLILFTALVILLLTTIVINTKRAKGKNPPGPSGLPFIGNLHQFDKAKPHIYLWKLSKKYGPLTYLQHGSTPILVVNSTKVATEILKSHDLSFCSRPSVVGQKKLAYEGLDIAFSPYNRHWRNMKKLCVLHLFSPKRVLSFRSVREDEVSRMISKISSLSSSSRPANLSEIAMSVASNFICRVAFGRRYDEDEYDRIRFDRLLLEAQALMVSFYFSDHFPALGWIDKVSGLLSRLDKNCKELDVFYQQLIDEHLDPSRPKPDTEDIIDLMIQLKHDKTSSSLDLTWDHIKALLMDLIVAGTDTVAAVIVWTMTALITRPEIMKKAQLEIRQVIDGKKGTVVDEDDMKKLPFLKAVVLESLRMYPPAPLIYRSQITEEDACLIDGHKIRPGTSVIVNGWAMARDPETWKNPDEFLPERFIASSHDTKVLLDKLEMIPFGGGRRGCPGMGMGLISTELALANLLYTFDWELPPDHDGTIDTDSLPGLTMHKKNPLVLVPKKYI